MSNTVIKVENLSKVYRVGEWGTGTISHDLNRWWAKMRGRPDPFVKVGSVNDRTQVAQNGELVSALNDINFEVKQGEVLGIIGKNGAGKSTLLKILSRITAPTTGQAYIKGRVASLLEVGTGFHPEMTGRENIFLNGAIHGMNRREITQKLDEIVDFAGVAKYLDTPVKRYSSGMTVRLGFAVAAFLEPEILIVDEVLAVGDAEFQKKAIGKMQEVSQGKGRTVLFVSHNMNAINQLCYKCLIIKNGEVDFNGEVKSAISYYLDINKSSNLLTSVTFSEDPNKDFQVLNATLIDKNNNKILSAIDTNDEFYLSIKYKFSRKFNKLHLTFIINNTNGEPIFFSDRTDYHKDFAMVEKGYYLSKLQIPNPLLVPGRYYLTIGCADIEGGRNDHKFNALLFEIENLSLTRAQKRDSYVFTPIKWELEKYDK